MASFRVINKPVYPCQIQLYNSFSEYVMQYWADELPKERRRIDVNAREINLTIDGLSPSTKYTLQMYAETKIGSGPSIESNFVSGVPPGFISIVKGKHNFLRIILELPGQPTSLQIFNVAARRATLQFTLGFDGHSVIRKWVVEARIGDSSIFEQIFNIRLILQFCSLFIL